MPPPLGPPASIGADWQASPDLGLAPTVNASGPEALALVGDPADNPTYQPHIGSFMDESLGDLQPRTSRRRFSWVHLLLLLSALAFLSAVSFAVYRVVLRDDAPKKPAVRSKQRDSKDKKDTSGKKASAKGVDEKSGAKADSTNGKKAATDKPNGKAGKEQPDVKKGDVKKGDVKKGDVKKGDVKKGDVKKGEVKKTSKTPPDTKKRKPSAPPRTVVVKSTPAATVFINGRKMGKTPFTRRLRGGRRSYFLALVVSKYEVHHERFRVSRKKGHAVQVELTKATYPRYVKWRRGVLWVVCHWRDRRRVFLDGKDTGLSCPKVGFYLKPGRYEVSLMSLETGRLKKRRVRIKRRRRSSLYFPKAR
jgi:hypothetical protein